MIYDIPVIVVPSQAHIINITEELTPAVGEDLYAVADRIYASSVALNGIPIGNDTTGAGTRANPYLTVDKAYTIATTGKAVLLNGDPATPTDYRHATFLTVAKAITIDSVVPLGAKISSTTTTTRVIHATILGALKLGEVIVDGQGLVPNLITVPVGASATTLQLYGTKFIGMTAAITNPSVNAKVILDARGCIATSSNVQCGGFYASSVDAGSSVSVVNCTFNVTDQTVERGVVQFRGNSAGMTAIVTGNTMNVTIKAGLAGSGSHSGVVLYNFVSTVADNEISVTGNVNNHKGFGIIVSPDAVGTAYSITGSSITDNAIYTPTKGGIGIQLGQDGQGSGADAVTSTGCIVRGNTVTSDAVGQAAAYHGILVGSPGMSGTVVSRNKVSTVDLALVDKVSTNTIWEANVTVNATSAHFRIKGAQNPTFRHNTAIEPVAGYVGRMVQITNNDIPVITNTVTATITANNFYASGMGTLGSMTTGDASQTATFTNNNYYGHTGATGPFNYNGVGYATLAAWQAVAPTATGADPLMVNVAGANYDLTASSPLKARVTRTTLLDYSGESYANPASIGAYS